MNSLGLDRANENPAVLKENSGPVILDISSDEEEDFGGGNKGDGFGGGRFDDRDDCEWLSEILGEVGGNKGDDSNDVVLISETFQNPPKRPRRDSLKLHGKFSGGDDDDCVVLECDPDKPAVAAPPPALASDGDGNNENDVEIIAEKGEVACRDFPHARHLCATYLFVSTAHEIHCRLCHCYVCDSVAPCPQWGTGVSSIDHCHATDKDEYWLAERKRIKKGSHPTPVAPVICSNSPARPVFAHALAPAHHVPIQPLALLNGHHPLPHHMVPVYRPRPMPGINPILKLHNARPLGSQPLTRTTHRTSTGIGSFNSHPVRVSRLSHVPSLNPVNSVPSTTNNNSVSKTTHQPSSRNDNGNLNFPRTHALKPCTSTSTKAAYPSISNRTTHSQTHFEFVWRDNPSSRPMILPDQSAAKDLGHQFLQPETSGFRQVTQTLNRIKSTPNDPNSQARQWQGADRKMYSLSSTMNDGDMLPMEDPLDLLPPSPWLTPPSTSTVKQFAKPRAFRDVMLQGKEAPPRFSETLIKSRRLPASVGLFPDEFSMESQGVVDVNGMDRIKRPEDTFEKGPVLDDNSYLSETIVNYKAFGLELDNWMLENRFEAPVSPLWDSFPCEPAPVVDSSNLFDV